MMNKVLRRKEVEEITGLSRATIYRYVRSGGFPPPHPADRTAGRLAGC